MMRNWNRREFTRNALMLTLFSPFIELLEPKLAKAQARPGNAKYLLIVTSNGTEPGVWNPAGSSPGSITFSSMTQPLSKIQNDVLLLNNFDSQGSAGNHGSIGALTGTGQYSMQTLSLDEWVARDLKSRGILTQVPSIHLGGVSGQQGLRFVNNGLQVPTFSLTQAFSNIFDGAAPAAPPPATGGGTTPAPTGPSAAELRLRRRQSILDLVKGEIGQLQGSLGGIEKQKLELHLDSIRQLEQRIKQQLDAATGTVSTGGDTAPGAPPVTFIQPVSCQQPGNLAGGLQPIENSAAHLDIAVAAFACDITRVALVEFGHHQSCPVSIPNAQGDWHNDFMHAQGSPRTKLIATEQWMSDRIVDLVGKLKATPAPGGGGTLFDQTYVLWAREMGDAVVHAGNNMPFVITGKAGGYLRNGNGYLSGGGAAHTQVLASAAEAMGATDLSTLGGPGKAAGDRTPFAGLRA
ncbi:MAG TPA: DUF1552 domain-containing protein [Polyangiaceae bacterium]|nr:DUF1552 domain-containing protein [Polyangiaceae bacterium]